MCFVFFIIGVFIGSIITNVLYLIRRASGTLKIDRSNPEKDVLRFEIDEKALNELHKKTRLELKIDPNADLSQN